MTVRINQSDQLIGSNWIRKANPERPIVGCVLPTVGPVLPTVGRVLPTVGRVLPTVGRVLPIVGRGLPAKGCPPWAGRELCRKMYGFSLHNYLGDLSYYFL